MATIERSAEAARQSAAADRDEITQLVYRYCRAMDRIDHQLGYSIWHEGATADYGEMYRGSGTGFIDWVCETHKAMLHHSHQVSNVIITLDGDSAGSESYVTAVLRMKEGEQLREMVARGRYIDRWARRDGRWGITERRYVHDFDEVRKVESVMFPGWGARDRGDVSYGVVSTDGRSE